MHKLLLLEDDKRLRETLIDIFEFNDFEVFSANNGREGLEVLDSVAPDIIVSDVMMPEIDGFEFLQKIKGNPLTEITPVILITANTVLDAKFKGLEYGANDYITKPFDSKELILKVKNLIALNQKKTQSVVVESEKLIGKVEVKSEESIFIAELNEKMLEFLDNEDLSVETLAQALFYSKSTFQRKVKKATNLTVNTYIRTFRLQYAWELLLKKSGNTSTIAKQTGFRSAAYFSYAFKQHYGISPSEVGK
jgi:DNA-binding response OmpR family regulator